ncbi:hypothetical protein MLD38_000112 [Melastoma candidum]|uniref:Uncharacterized protein n=1 Tax=Melastoma candidum TaxID=119954 RepID=A0ACB9S928_9MYRT|nr:hypothetical protein MLD38_000112 [Melastoma candidum]
METSLQETTGGQRPSPAPTSWRKGADDNLKRLHSLLFGAEQALDRRDFAAAHVMSLQLIGFLDSETRSEEDASFIQPIRRDALAKLGTARQALVADSDRRVFETVEKAPGCVFNKKIDVGKIRQSKFFRALLQHSNGQRAKKELDDRDHKEKSDAKISKNMKQATLASLYGNNLPRQLSNKNSMTSKDDDSCIIVDKDHSFHGRRAFLSPLSKAEEEEEEKEKHPANTLGTKRILKDMKVANDDIEEITLDEDACQQISGSGFVTAKSKLEMDARQKRGSTYQPSTCTSPQNDVIGRSYGVRSSGSLRRGVRNSFIPPVKSNASCFANPTARAYGKSDDGLDDSTRKCLEMLYGPDGELPENLRNLEPRLIEHVSNEIMDRDPNVRWVDIAGLEHAKKCVTEMVIWPLLRPDIFKGCRSPGRGLLLFGPPGTGKTMIGKAIAGEAKATFFYISASSLTSKWIGEGEKLVRALFGVAHCRQPAVIFVDEIDSLLSQRKSDGEHESSRRLKTQFLIEMEGFDSGGDQVLLIGATNRPQELDEAARRRLTKRLYIPLPSSEARAWIIRNLLEKDGLFKLSNEDMVTICRLTEGYSGSDMKNLVKDASMGPLRDALGHGIDITRLESKDMRPVTVQDFESALQEVRPSVSQDELGIYEEWNKQFGSLSL